MSKILMLLPHTHTHTHLCSLIYSGRVLKVTKIVKSTFSTLQFTLQFTNRHHETRKANEYTVKRILRVINLIETIGIGNISVILSPRAQHPLR